MEPRRHHFHILVIKRYLSNKFVINNNLIKSFIIEHLSGYPLPGHDDCYQTSSLLAIRNQEKARGTECVYQTAHLRADGNTRE